jgi:hypothetical protein
MVWWTARLIASINLVPMPGAGGPASGTWSSVKKSRWQALHSNTLTSHSPSARMLRGVSTIGLPQFAQVGDVGMA